MFCIENVAAEPGVHAEQVYKAFTDNSNILNGYIVPEYEVSFAALGPRLSLLPETPYLPFPPGPPAPLCR